MLENQIHPLRERIESLLASQTPLDVTALLQWKSFLSTESERIKASTVTQVLAHGNQAQASLYLLFLQTELTSLADTLYRCLEIGGEPLLASQEPSPPFWAKETLSEIRGLLEYLQQYFPHLFHFDRRAPLACRAWHAADLVARRALIFPFFQACRLEEPLFFLLREYLHCLGGSTAYTPDTWRDYRYLQGFAEEMAALIGKDQDTEAAYHTLMRQLFCLNFNTPAFYEYCTRKVTDLTQRHCSFREQRRELLHLLKLCRQPPERPGIGFDPGSPSIQCSVVKFIEEELDYLKQVEKLHAEPVINGKSRQAYPFYFQVSCTAAHLAFFVRLLVEAGLIITDKKADLHAFISNHIGTAKKERLSGHSLKNKSYAPTQEAARRMKAQLHLILQLLNEKYL
jgi:hypothetical protein